MTQRSKAITPTPPQPTTEAPTQLWRLAEIMHIKRLTMYSADGNYWYYECQLCLEKSRLTDRVIEHQKYCPVYKMKNG